MSENGRKKISLPWGKETLELALPENFTLLNIAEPKILPGLSDENVISKLNEILRSPASSKPLAELVKNAKNILFIVDDIGRPTPAHKLLGTLLQTVFDARGKEEKFPLLFATGVHREMTVKEMKNKIGAENYEKVSAESHNTYKTENLVYVGETRQGTKFHVNKKVMEAELRIVIGTIEPHVQAGFGGGYKNILPGCAGPHAIGHNHYIGATPELFSMIGYAPENNPMRQDIEEACGKLPGKTFIVNTVLNPQLEIVDIVAGDPIHAHRKGIRLAREMYGVEIGEQADVVLTNSYPLDVNFRQAVKGIANTLFAAKENGVIASFQNCPLGFDDVKLKLKLPFTVNLIRKILRLLGKNGVHGLCHNVLKKLPPEERFFAYFAAQMVRRNQLVIYSEQLKKELNNGASFPVPVEDNDRALFEKISRAMSAKKNGRITVNVFPQGGVTYPILKETGAEAQRHKGAQYSTIKGIVLCAFATLSLCH